MQCTGYGTKPVLLRTRAGPGRSIAKYPAKKEGRAGTEQYMVMPRLNGIATTLQHSIVLLFHSRDSLSEATEPPLWISIDLRCAVLNSVESLYHRVLLSISAIFFGSRFCFLK